MSELEYTELASTYIFGKADLDQVQDVLSGKRTGRGCGKTFAIIMQMLGEVWLGAPGNMYLYVGESPKWTEHALPPLHIMGAMKEILVHEKFTVTIHHDRLFVGDERHLTKVFLFWAADGMLPARTPGYHFAHTFLDISPELYYKWVSGTEIEQWKNVSRLS